MSLSRGDFSFHHVGSSVPGFDSTLGSSSIYALQSTGVREWQGPSGRAVRIASKKPDDFYVVFGSSDMAHPTTNTATTLGGTVESWFVPASVTHVAIKSSTDIVANICLGYGS